MKPTLEYATPRLGPQAGLHPMAGIFAYGALLLLSGCVEAALAFVICSRMLPFASLAVPLTFFLILCALSVWRLINFNSRRSPESPTGLKKGHIP